MKGQLSKEIFESVSGVIAHGLNNEFSKAEIRWDSVSGTVILCSLVSVILSNQSMTTFDNPEKRGQLELLNCQVI